MVTEETMHTSKGKKQLTVLPTYNDYKAQQQAAWYNYSKSTVEAHIHLQ